MKILDRELDFVLLYCLPCAFYAYNLVVIRMTLLTEYIAFVEYFCISFQLLCSKGQSEFSIVLLYPLQSISSLQTNKYPS